MRYFLVYIEANGIWTNVLVKADSSEEAEIIATLEIERRDGLNVSS